MARYRINWLKEYYRTGTMEIEAEDQDEAEMIALERLGNEEGSLHYDGGELREVEEVCDEQD